jgi:hypothetical protein
VLKFRLQATTRKKDGQLNKPYVHQVYIDAPDIASAIQQAADYRIPQTDSTTIAWLTQINQPNAPDMVVWAMTARDGAAN